MNPNQFTFISYPRLANDQNKVLFALFALRVLVITILLFYFTPNIAIKIAMAQEFTTEPIGAIDQFELCEKAQTAGYMQYGKYLLNPKDFQTLELQTIVQPYLTRLNRILEEKDIELITLVLPPRGVLFPELDINSQNGYVQLITALEQTGLQVNSISDVLDIYGADFFFEYDHHWTPFGAREVAKDIATSISIDPDLQQDFISEQIRYSWTPYNSRLQTLSKLCGEDYVTRANPTSEAGFLTTWSTSMSATEGLFDNRATELTQASVLIGTSNSESSTLNFAGFLSEQTGLSISNYSFSSSGALGSMMHYFLSTEYQQSKPPYIFWEFLANPHTTDYNLNAIKYYRQIIPSITGSCESKPLAHKRFELRTDSPRQYVSLFENESVLQSINSSDYYLSFDLSGDYLDRTIVDIEYNSGTIDQNSLHLLAPIAGKQQAYLEFLDTSAGDIKSINLTFPPVPAPNSFTEVNVNLCLSP